MSLAPGARLGRYEICSKIGEGGMGEVYLAQDTRLDRKVALKILPVEVAAHEDRMRRFVQEAKSASALNHPNILTIHEIDETHLGHFIATEFVDGDTLRARIRKAPMKLGEVLEIATQIASALSAAHAAGIVHRDIKPENIMLRRDGIVKVLDFGLAKLTEQLQPDLVDTEAPTRAAVRTNPGVVLGTALYMSPEQARGLEVDARTDIFSLGVLVYEMVAGRLPFEGSNANEILAAILSDKEPPPLARYSKAVPPELERIVSKALRKNRNIRYQTIKDLLLDVQSLSARLAFEAQLERSAPLAEETTVSGEHQTRHDTATGSTARAASSVEYLVNEIKRHKLATLIVIMAIAVIVLVSFYNRGGNRDVAIESIAVLPFVNENNDPNTDYLSDGIPESIINILSQLPNLKVMSRNSVFHYRGKEMNAQAVGKELQVHAVLTGRLVQRGDALSISVELINAQDNRQIWGQQYNRRLADVFAVQEELAKEISEKLRLRLTGVERQQLAKRSTEDLKAFQYYMQGRAYVHRNAREDLLTAVRYFEKATEEDRNYALAYAGLAEAYATLGARGWMAPLEGRRKTEEAARKALSLDENLAEGHSALGQSYTTFAPSDFSLGDRELRHAIELSPSLASAHSHLGYSLVRQGRLDESLTEMLKARELDPLSSIIMRNVALPYYLKRDYVRALEVLRKANELGPALTTTVEVSFYIQNRLFDEVLAELEKAKRERPNDPILIYDSGMVYAALGQRAEALQIIRELEEMSGASLNQAHWIAKIYATLNEKDQAFAWLERGLAVGAIGSFYKDEPVWDSIRKDPRFADLLRRMGIQL
jgi:serine/threonine protein kinase/Flp pilus assembly protein TadD